MNPPTPGTIEPSQRGTLTVAQKAIEKIASSAASEVPGISGSTGGFLGVGTRSDETARPKVDVQLSGLIATIRISAGVQYPTPLRTATERLREHVRQEVSARCGVEVRQVDIDIDELVTSSHSTGRRELL
ncbi:Asp23/Gls24 family envelope stress response protein [Arthrobacter sp. H41]|uniref:Asp23/Gls24 family envelope stress response protein n=1 Tax=Arthrobacter sp. H41 TaxID=1312978 RepID=UPI00047D1ECA|nr:Asp23/Gls24 family envelope stress response protein [Arthrobacter sp. H41]